MKPNSNKQYYTLYEAKNEHTTEDGAVFPTNSLEEVRSLPAPAEEIPKFLCRDSAIMLDALQYKCISEGRDFPKELYHHLGAPLFDSYLCELYNGLDHCESECPLCENSKCCSTYKEYATCDDIVKKRALAAELSKRLKESV